MKISKLVVALLSTVCTIGVVHASGSNPATTSTSTTGQQQGQVTETTTAAISQQGQGIENNSMGNLNYNSTVNGSKIPVAAAATPIIVTSNDTCMGSTSAGISTVTIGASFATTWTDKNCVMLKNARELWNMQMKAAALARMCGDKDNLEALELTGYICPQTLKAQGKLVMAPPVVSAPVVEAPKTPVVPAVKEVTSPVTE